MLYQVTPRTQHRPECRNRNKRNFRCTYRNDSFHINRIVDFVVIIVQYILQNDPYTMFVNQIFLVTQNTGISPKATLPSARRDRYCMTPIFRVEEIFAIFANLDFARNFPPAKILSTGNGISRNFPPAKFSSRENKIIIAV